MEGAYWFFQPLGRMLILFRITPNQVSWASFVFGVLAGACLTVGHFGFGAFFGTISAVLDALDGLVARVTGKASDAGEVLDAAVDRYTEFFYLGGLIFYYREVPVLMALAFAALVGAFMVSYSTAKAEALHIDAPKSNMRRPERSTYLLLGAALSPLTIPYFEVIREYPIAIGHPMVIALALVAVLANISAVERFWAIAKAIRVRESQQKRAAAAAAVRQSMASVTEQGMAEEHDALEGDIVHQPIRRG
jgi:phosphatidylglycerophosphate synthase